jgi:hypothetical protein
MIQGLKKVSDKATPRERLVLRCTDGTTAVLYAGEVLWRCDADLRLEGFLNNQWSLKNAGDSLQELALRLREAVRDRGVVKLRTS